MNKSQVEIFMLMVREGSIHFASQRLSIAPSLITTSICALENELGFNLITRGRSIRKVILTEKGHAFYRLAPDLLRLLNAIADIRGGIKQPGKTCPPGAIINSGQENTGRF
ncbi:LysR family transcriptional regulator [Klebsiella oxytoca]|uniref:LysR family transcriptional regulator n=1 Tax=Klebsiella oxytoca TaxID=571 RepID=UPI001D0E86BE|nr:LysR family transcriptional regulator [Klebsiella oxytoca]